VTSGFLPYFLILFAGISLGALGSGGSVLMFPIFVYVLGIDPKPAVGMSMAVAGSTSLVGAFIQWRRGNLMVRPAVFFAAAGIPGAYLGALGTHLVSSQALQLLFAAIMIVVAVRLLTSTPRESMEHECAWQQCIPAGFALGILTGFLGVGGGFLIVPALVWLAGLDAKKAMGTSPAIIAMNAAAGLIGQHRYVRWDAGLTGKLLAFSLIGMVIGIAIACRIPERGLRRAFAVLVLGLAVVIVWQVARGR
jgi:uncharacterized membrane protein YfcA